MMKVKRERNRERERKKIKENKKNDKEIGRYLIFFLY